MHLCDRSGGRLLKDLNNSCKPRQWLVEVKDVRCHLLKAAQDLPVVAWDQPPTFGCQGSRELHYGGAFGEYLAAPCRLARRSEVVK
eukprot:CAMPEP_0184517780 /NCGR_PEP_ID=MMETSP0198_2-20121128/5737_1 /TAXON_ID=1112570 /ORGANISM="Thraustochytrium sp., Strain LLF1b" /LENGTH=85 /DNA_ID=CAMNT_0026908175 /DNA_START=1072 /DNA_END=1329 /DNA_ORIENTATION=+